MALGSNLGDRGAPSTGSAGGVGTLCRRPLWSPPPASRKRRRWVASNSLPISIRWFSWKLASSPAQLLQALQAIEQAQGRKRTERWGSRTLDLDIVRFGERRVTER